jgi:hypothetical protein
MLSSEEKLFSIRFYYCIFEKPIEKVKYWKRLKNFKSKECTTNVQEVKI